GWLRELGLKGRNTLRQVLESGREQQASSSGHPSLHPLSNDIEKYVLDYIVLIHASAYTLCQRRARGAQTRQGGGDATEGMVAGRNRVSGAGGSGHAHGRSWLGGERSHGCGSDRVGSRPTGAHGAGWGPGVAGGDRSQSGGGVT